MIEDLDEALRRFLIRELPIRNSEVDIKFDQPKREWSSRLSRPTLNLFLYNVQENTKLRAREQQRIGGNGRSAVQQRWPTRVDLNYMITAWANEAEDEHRLLTRTLMVFFRTGELPDDILPERLHAQPMAIPVEVAQPGVLQNLTDIWSVLDNEMRPAVACTLTLALNPYEPVTSPLVLTREIVTNHAVLSDEPASSDEPPPLKAYEPAGQSRFWTIGGNLYTDKPVQDLSLRLVERGLDVPITPEGRFVNRRA